MHCLEAHCGDCHHICVNSPVFKPTQEERVEILLTDDLIVSKKDLKQSGVMQMTPEEMINFVRDCEELYSL